MTETSHEQKAMLSFSIGPVQSFIATARSTRDLWTGSWLLSHLTRQAIGAVGEDTVVFPKLGESDSDSAACLPNVFLALVPHDQANDLASKVVEATKAAWFRIAADVRRKLDSHWGSGTWADGWNEQVNGFFDIRCITLPPDGKPYGQRFADVGRLVAAHKALRHVEPPEPDEESRPKCSLTGSHSQMGPTGATLSEQAKWWKQVGENSVEGTHVREQERLCAISLVKRFAWVASIQSMIRADDDERRFPDTATVAAAIWLKDHNVDWAAIAKCPINGRRHGWSGQWLHWSEKQLRGEEKLDYESSPSREIAQQIINARTIQRPPIYYAILMMDGDHMGRRVRLAAGDPQHPEKSHRALSETLANFADRHTGEIVANYDGTLVYSGGDDVLALLPVAKAAECADALQTKFGQLLPATGDLPQATMSAGIVFAHYKSDLRFALQEARAAEKEAKISRNCLCIRVLKRSGEHASATLGWNHVPDFRHFVKSFAPSKSDPHGQATDRWVYSIERSATTLSALHATPGVIESEIKRTIGKSGKQPVAFLDYALKFWTSLLKRAQEIAVATKGSFGETVFEQCIKDYCFLVRIASFVTRGREEQR